MVAILIVSTPVHGHVTPLLSVARHLLARGHRVRFLTGEAFRDRVEQTGAEFLPLPAEAESDFAVVAGRRLTGVAGMRYDITELFLRPVPEQFAALDGAIAAEPTDVVLAETMFFAAAALLTRPRHERPAVINLGIVPLTLASVDTAPFGLGLAPLPGPIGRVRNALLSVVARRVIFGSVQKEAVRLVEQVTGNRLDSFFMDASALADAIVQFTVPAFEYPRSDLPATVSFVGPVSRTAPSDTAVPEWWGELDGSRPVVHVTQGTVANADYDELIAPTMAALADENVLVVVSTGGRDVSTLGPLPANVRAASYLPYDRLLPLTDVYVTNGGYGGVHVAMEHGVPLVVAGQTEDKVEVSARVAWSGVGVNLRTSRPTAEAVRKAVLEVLATSRYRDASAAVGAQIAAAPGLPGLETAILATLVAGGSDTPSPVPAA